MIQEYEDKSTLLTLFEAIKAKISANVDEISEVVVFSDQENNEDIQRPFEYPYVSVQIVIDWDSNEARGTNYDNPPITGAIGLQSKGIAIITIHTLFKNREDDTDNFITNEPIRHKVHRAVHLLHDDLFFTRLIKIQDRLPDFINASQDYPTVYMSNVKEGALIEGTLDSIDEFGVDESGSRPDLTIP